MVLAALVTAWRLAIWPPSRSPLSVKPTTVGVVRPPSLFGTICTAPPSKTATQQLVVPKSIPTTLPITFLSRGELGQAVSRRLGGGLVVVWTGRGVCVFDARARRPRSGLPTERAAQPLVATLTIAGRRSL